MKIFNSITRTQEEFKPLKPLNVSIYTCGPTVYDHVHIGNLRTYIFEDMLRRTLNLAGYRVNHVMNITDIDDKTIESSKKSYPGDLPANALKMLTNHYESIFLGDAKKIGIDFSGSKLVKATEHIRDMQELILEIPNKYITDGGIYFDITKFPSYGTLVKLDQSHTHHRIQNDEYDKDHVADFALWKAKKEGEPSWDFEIGGKNIAGRPGWHIECSTLSTKYLGQPFDIHTGGVDLIFPHHENEIAQSVSASHKTLANVFVHSEHLLVDGRKMSKSLNNFYTLEDVIKRGIDPMAFRLLVLQAHYRSQLNFTWKSLESAQTFLRTLWAWADSTKQPAAQIIDAAASIRLISEIKTAMECDLNSARALAQINEFVDKVSPTVDLLYKIDDYFGLNLANRPDISGPQKEIIAQREEARKTKDWASADGLRKQLQEQGIEINDTPYGPIWSRG